MKIKKNTVLTAFVLLVIIYFLADCWITIFKEGYLIKWQHITALSLFIPLPILFFRNYRATVLGIGIYLILGFFRLLSLTVGISTGSFGYLGLEVSGFNWLCLGLFIIYFIIHMNELIEIKLDYDEHRAQKQRR